MDYEFLVSHRRNITRNYMRNLANLIKNGRLTEAKNLNIRYTGIIGLWEIQEANRQESALKDGSATQRIQK